MGGIYSELKNNHCDMADHRGWDSIHSIYYVPTYVINDAETATAEPARAAAVEDMRCKGSYARRWGLAYRPSPSMMQAVLITASVWPFRTTPMQNRMIGEGSSAAPSKHVKHVCLERTS